MRGYIGFQIFDLVCLIIRRMVIASCFLGAFDAYEHKALKFCARSVSESEDRYYIRFLP